MRWKLNFDDVVLFPHRAQSHGRKVNIHTYICRLLRICHRRWATILTSQKFLLQDIAQAGELNCCHILSSIWQGNEKHIPDINIMFSNSCSQTPVIRSHEVTLSPCVESKIVFRIWSVIRSVFRSAICTWYFVNTWCFTFVLRQRVPVEAVSTVSMDRYSTECTSTRHKTGNYNGTPIFIKFVECESLPLSRTELLELEIVRPLKFFTVWLLRIEEPQW